MQQDIMDYLHTTQWRFTHKSRVCCTHPRNGDKQRRSVTCAMVAILTDWLVEVALEYHLVDETLHLSLLYVYRYLAQAPNPVTTLELQLVGVTCMWIASKFEEIFAPGVDDFVYISDNSYSRMQVIEMETTVLNTLDYTLAQPTILAFVCYYADQMGLSYDQDDAQSRYLFDYLAELAACDCCMCCSFGPSTIALSVIILGLSLDNVPQALIKFGQHAEAWKQCVMDLHSIWSAAKTHKLQAVQTKYGRFRHQNVVEIQPPPLKVHPP